MDIFYFDANFFIPAGKFNHHFITLKRIINKIRNKYKLKITSLVRKEIRHFDEIIQLYFETEMVEDTADFKRFCNASKFAIGPSKKAQKYADASLAYSAANETSNTYIVSNDEGFIRLKNRRPDLLKNVEIIEPTDFMKWVMFEVDDNNFKNDIKDLIILYAEYFITYLLEDKRSIGRILESLLIIKEETLPKVSNLAGVNGTHQLSKEDEIIFENYILNKNLEPSDRKRFKVILDLFKPFIDYYQSFNAENHQLLTKLLYIYFPELLTKLRLISESLEPEIAPLIPGIEKYLLKKIFNIRVKETVSHIKDCYFEKAFYHFRPLLESDWNFNISTERKSILKFLYGVFLLNIEDFEFFEYLISKGFWKDFPQINQLLNAFLNILKDNTKNIKIQELTDSDLKLFYHLGLYYSNTGNRFGLKIFKTIFNLEEERVSTLEWYKEFLERYLLELRIYDEEVNEDTRDKFLKFLDGNQLDNNTKQPFDKSYFLSEFTPLTGAAFFFKQPMFIVKADKINGFFEMYCWNQNIKSLILLKIPEELIEHVENMRIIVIKKGDVMTKNLPKSKKPRARIMVILNKECKLELQRFHIDIEDSY